MSKHVCRFDAVDHRNIHVSVILISLDCSTLSFYTAC